jgi:hypothetical protein
MNEIHSSSSVIISVEGGKSTNVMSPTTIENIIADAIGTVRSPIQGKMKVKPVIIPKLAANNGIGTNLSSYSNRLIFIILGFEVLAFPRPFC